MLEYLALSFTFPFVIALAAKLFEVQCAAGVLERVNKPSSVFAVSILVSALFVFISMYVVEYGGIASQVGPGDW